MSDIREDVEDIISHYADSTVSGITDYSFFCDWMSGAPLKCVQEIVAYIEKLQAQNRESETCDLCKEKATYHLCQVHLDELRWPDVYRSVDGDFPPENQMALVQEEGEDIFIGGYDEKREKWYCESSYIDTDKPVYWCYLFDPKRVYEVMTAVEKPVPQSPIVEICEDQEGGDK
jgi:hypothetical protein